MKKKCGSTDDAISTPQAKLLKHFQAIWYADFWYEISISILFIIHCKQPHYDFPEQCYYIKINHSKWDNLV